MTIATENADSLYFLSGGGEMGQLIRDTDWSKTPLGDPKNWLQSLRIAVRIMLDTPFSMYIAWGKEYIQLYNDGYRPILGATKHPQALGTSTRKTFAEIWPTIGPMFEGVMQGTPIGFPDFTLQLDRNGFLEECVFDFSYSPIRLEDGEVGGVLVTVIETTEKVKAAKALKESEQALQFAIEATELGTWDLNPVTNRFRGNSRLKEWFGLRPDEEIALPLALAVIADKDREMVITAIQTALQLTSGGHYDIIYTIIHPQTKNERIVRAKGRASFNADGLAYRFNGTLQDVTKEMVARQLLTESEQRLGNERMVLYNSFMNAPAGIAILKGDSHIYEFANAEYEKLVGRKITPGKTLKEHFPELEQQGMITLLDNVFTTGKPFISNELPVKLNTKGAEDLENFFLNLVVQPLKNENGNVERILAHIINVTEQVETRQQVEEANQNLRIAATLSENIADAVVGTDMDYKIISWNKGAENLYGYTNEEVMGKYPLEFLGTQFLTDEDKNKWQKDLDTIGKWQGEVLQSKKDGTLLNVLVSIAYVYDVNGKPVAGFAVNRNITERKKAEEKIAESEAKFRVLSETIPHMVWTATPDGKKNFFNKFFLEYTGLTFEALKGDGWHKIIYPDDLEKELAQWRHNIKTGKDFRSEKRVRHHNGTYRWHLSHSIPQENSEGKITGWIGTNTDITEQKSFTEELEIKVIERTNELHIQNETFKQAEESSMQGSYSFNLTTGKLTYSDNLYRLIGYETNEFEPSLEEFNKHVHPEDRDFVQKAAEKVLQNNTVDEWHYRMITKTEQVINIKGTGRVIDSGVEKLLVGTLQDVTKEFELNKELQEKEAYRKQIINNAPDAVIVINEKSIITLWNPKTEEIFGWKAEEVVGLHLTDTIIPPQYRQSHREGMKRFLQTGEARILNKTLELTALNKESKEFPISITISQATQQGSKLFIAFLRDITLEKQNKEELIFKTKQLEEMNQSLELKNKELENSNAELASFSYIASHDLQEPLRKIQTFGKRILETEKFSNKTQDYFNRIITSGERMQNLIISLLDFSRTNTTDLVFESCDLNTIVEESISDLQISILEKQAIIEYENLGIINGMRIQLLQLFTNLIDNAIKYSRPGIKPLIKIITSVVEGKEIDNHLASQKQYHVIKIADNGIGFENEYAAKIFEIFQRLHGKNEYSGTGIGLAIVKKIVTNHNGFVVAEGIHGVGSTFTIYIPTT